MVAHIEPIADLLAITINGERFACECVVNDERDEFFGKMVRAVVVGAICREDGEPVGVMVGADEVVAGGFAGGIGAIGLVSVGFLESRVLGRERTIDLVGGHMQKAKCRLIVFAKAPPVSACGLKKMESSNNVGLDKLSGAMNRAVHMRLGGEVHNSARLVLGEDFVDEDAIADIPSNKDVARIGLKRSEILQVAGVSKFVEIDDGCGFRLDPVENEVRADKTGTAGDEDGVFHKFRKHEISRIYTKGRGGGAAVAGSCPAAVSSNGWLVKSKSWEAPSLNLQAFLFVAIGG